MHVDLQPKSPLFCLQGSGPPGLGHYALKVEASGKVALSIAGCLLQVSFPAYCFKPIRIAGYVCELETDWLEAVSWKGHL